MIILLGLNTCDRYATIHGKKAGFFISNTFLTHFHLRLRLLRQGVNFRLKVAKKIMEQYLKIYSQRTNDLRKDDKTLLHK